MATRQGVRRREFLKAAAAGAALTALGGRFAWGADPPQSRRPNILLIISDEHNATVTGCYGNKLVQTRHLDQLASRGVTFDAAYTNSPLCVPARLAITAGKYISRTGGWNNDCWLPSADYPSIARAMNAAGYESFLCGKMHYDATCRYGFTDVGSKNFNPSHHTGRGNRRSPDDLTCRGLSGRFNEFHTAARCGHEAHDGAVTEGVTDFLAKRKRSDKPFFLLAGYIAPHFPLIIPPAYHEPYQGKVAMPNIPPGFLDSLPLNYKHLRAGFQVVDVPDDIVRKGRELYYGLTQWIDEQIGRTLKALAASEVADDTIVIYTTDHGENMGEHGLWWKNCLYQQAARVPLIISRPERWKGGQRRVGACSHVDMVRTIAELGGATVPDDWNGTSLCSYLDDPAAKWKDLAVSEYYAHNIASGYAMLRQGPYKYVYHTPPDEQHPAQRELYDLTSDPEELKNLAAHEDQKARIEAMHASLVKEVGGDPNETELRCRADYAKGYGRGAAQGAGEGTGAGKAEKAGQKRRAKAQAT